jgi:hypothetical protein
MTIRIADVLSEPRTIDDRGRSACRAFIDVGADDVQPAPRETLGDLASEPAPCPGDDGDLAHANAIVCTVATPGTYRSRVPSINCDTC